MILTAFDAIRALLLAPFVATCLIVLAVALWFTFRHESNPNEIVERARRPRP